jgi:hypothetical protein
VSWVSLYVRNHNKVHAFVRTQFPCLPGAHRACACATCSHLKVGVVCPTARAAAAGPTAQRAERAPRDIHRMHACSHTVTLTLFLVTDVLNCAVFTLEGGGHVPAARAAAAGPARALRGPLCPRAPPLLGRPVAGRPVRGRTARGSGVLSILQHISCNVVLLLCVKLECAPSVCCTHRCASEISACSWMSRDRSTGAWAPCTRPRYVVYTLIYSASR